MRLHICGHAVQPTLQAANSFVAAHWRLSGPPWQGRVGASCGRAAACCTHRVGTSSYDCQDSYWWLSQAPQQEGVHGGECRSAAPNGWAFEEPVAISSSGEYWWPREAIGSPAESRYPAG